MVRFATLATKHPGFAEEQEWRILYAPTLQESKWVTNEIVTLDGIPQLVYKLPLQNISEVGLTAGIPELLDRIIIGPTQFLSLLAGLFRRCLKRRV
jgi:hypothetical protein